MSQRNLRRPFRRHDEVGHASERLCLPENPSFYGFTSRLLLGRCLQTPGCVSGLCQTDFASCIYMYWRSKSSVLRYAHFQGNLNACTSQGFIRYILQARPCALAMRVESPTMLVGSRTQRISICQPAHSTSTVAPGRRQLTAGRRQPAPCLLELWSEGSK